MNQESPIPVMEYKETNSWHIDIYTTNDKIYGFKNNGKKKLYCIVNNTLHYIDSAEGEPICPVGFNYTIKE